MQRINALDPAASPAASKTILDAIQKKIGMVPNFFKTLAHAPAGLKFYTQQVETLTGGVLSPGLREQLAIAVAASNGCDYCASAHTLMGKGAGLNPTELASSLNGHSENTKVQAALVFAKEIVRSRGHLTNEQFDAVRRAGYSDAEVVEIIAHVGMNTFTNYFNNLAKTTIDFPHVSTSATALTA